MNRQQTLPVLYIYGNTDDNNVHKEESRTWYNSMLDAMCWRMQKNSAKNRMHVPELTPQLKTLIRVRIKQLPFSIIYLSFFFIPFKTQHIVINIIVF